MGFFFCTEPTKLCDNSEWIFAIITLILLLSNQEAGPETPFLIGRKEKWSHWPMRGREETHNRQVWSSGPSMLSVVSSSCGCRREEHTPIAHGSPLWQSAHFSDIIPPCCRPNQAGIPGHRAPYYLLLVHPAQHRVRGWAAPCNAPPTDGAPATTDLHPN